MFQSTVKKSLVFFLILLGLVLSTLFILFINSPLQPFQLTNDLAVEPDFKKKAEVNDRDSLYTSLIRYQPDMAEFLNSRQAKDLTSFRCSDSIIRTNEGVYILENQKTTTYNKRRVKNQSFLEFLQDKEKSLPKGKKILTVKVCETEKKTILLFYSIGNYGFKSADNVPIGAIISRSVDNEAIVQIIPPKNALFSRTFTFSRSPGHLRCDETFQITSDNHLYLLCNEKYDELANSYIYDLNLLTGKARIIGKCLNDYSEELKTVCN